MCFDDTALIFNKITGQYTQWCHGRVYVCRCTDRMSPNTINQWLRMGWYIWNIPEYDPRYNELCPGNQVLCSGG